MKYKYYLIILLLWFLISCSKPIYIGGRNYHNMNGKEYLMESFKFIDNDICIYTQSFHCELSDDYKEFEMICRYKIKGNHLLLFNNYPIDSLKDKIYLRLPEDEINKCIYMTRFSIDPAPDGKLMIGRPPSHNDGYYIGYYNYFEKAEYIFKDSIFYYKHIINFPDDRGFEVKTNPYVISELNISELLVNKEANIITNDGTIKPNIGNIR